VGKLGVGVIGCGYWGPNLVRNFARHPDAEVRAVCDAQPERAQRVGGEYRVPSVGQRAEDVIADPSVQLVVVATPTHTHFPLAKQALEAGRHVLVMKPVATRSEEAEELCAIADRKGVLLAVDHTFVFTPAVQKIKELVTSGELGELFYFDSVRVNLGLFQADINVLWDLAPHDVSILDFVVGSEPQEVVAVGAAHGGSPTENIAYISMKYANGFLAGVHVNWLAPAKVRRLILGGSRKMVVYDDVEPSEKVKVYDRGVTIGGPTDGDSYRLLIEYRTGDVLAPQLSNREALASEADNIVRAVRGQTGLLADGRSGVRVTRILEAAHESIVAGGAPVRLPVLAGRGA
jgi:predicted dehydrogenase